MFPKIQIEDNTLQISSFVACTYNEKWRLGMVAQVSDEFGDHKHVKSLIRKKNMLHCYVVVVYESIRTWKTIPFSYKS